MANVFWVFSPLLDAQSATPTVTVTPVISKSLDRTVQLPGELVPYERVTLHARVAGYVEDVLVDRGSQVTKGQVLVKLSAPELLAQVTEGESKAEAADAQRAEAEAQLASGQSTYERLKAASATDGAVAGNELIQTEKAVDAANALVRSRESAARAARAAVKALTEMQQYLEVRAPFAGVITERFVHPGALVGPSGGDAATGALLRLEQVTRLRLVVAVPEADYAGIVRGARVPFRVSAHAGETFTGTVARLSQTLDPKTRTMAVELDVANPASALAPGMYPEVAWPVQRPTPSLLVPSSSVVTTTERTFVIRVAKDRAEWVTVRRGAIVGNQVEVVGTLRAGDMVVAQGTDEIRDGAVLNVRTSKGN
jgi:RND family efflux transporter MFP subunit